MDKISVVTALYRSSPYIKEFYSRHLTCLQQLNVSYEFIFVNDGSPDNSEKIVEEIIQTNKCVKLVSLSRNFGQYPAMFAGLAKASGNYIYALDCDLEEEPENILILYNKIISDPKIDVVYCVLNQRNGGFFRSISAKLFYFILDYLSEVKVPHNQAWQRIMSRKYTDALLQYKETETLPAGLMTLTGFSQVPVFIEKKYKGSTAYTFSKRLKLAVNSITAFSSKPLTLIGIMGIAITTVAFTAILIVLFKKIFLLNFQSGWISLIASIWLIGGLILSSIGIIGIYLAKIFNQIKNRPLYIIKSTSGFNE